jgi:hypothetical protein
MRAAFHPPTAYSPVLAPKDLLFHRRLLNREPPLSIGAVMRPVVLSPSRTMSSPCSWPTELWPRHSTPPSVLHRTGVVPAVATAAPPVASPDTGVGAHRSVVVASPSWP